MDVLKIFESRFIPFGQVFDSIAEGVCVAGSDFGFIYWNEAAKAILYDEPDNTEPSEWATRYGLFDIESGQPLKYEDLPMIKALNGESFTDYRILSKNASNPEGYILSVNGRPIRNGEATVGGVTTFSDITAEVNLQKELTSERAFYKNILDLMPGIVFIKNLEGTFIYGNKAFHELLETGNVIGRRTDDFLGKEEARKIKENDKKVLQSGEAHMFEEVIYWKDGNRSIFHTTRFPWTSPDGLISGICAVAHDITRQVDDRIQIEKEREKSAHVSKLASLGTLAAEIAHELRNPMSILSTTSKIIKSIVEKNLPDKATLLSQLKVMGQTVTRMNEVINSLNSLSKDSSVEIPTKFKVQDMLHDIVAISSYRIKTAKIKFEVEYPKGDPGYLYANQVQVSEVLLNLVMNAFDAVEGLKEPKVWIKVWREYDDMNIEVYDSGAGVSPAYRQKIFEPYFTTKAGKKGTGLGLSISTKIVKQHNGSLDYHHSEGGHCFKVKIPLVISGA